MSERTINDPFSYSKDWRSYDDFPTVQKNETRAREDLQYLFTEIESYFNDTLLPVVRTLNQVEIGPDTVNTVAIIDGAVTEDKIDGGAVTSNKLGVGAVTFGKVGASAIETQNLIDYNVTLSKLDIPNQNNPHSNPTITPAALGCATATHARQHAYDGTDPITPASIKAATASDLTETASALSTHTNNSSNPHSVTYTQVGAPPATHASQHASTGTDPIAPADIGASAVGHTHIVSDVTDLASEQIRAIYYGTDDPADYSGFPTPIPEGTIYIQYTAPESEG